MRDESRPSQRVKLPARLRAIVDCVEANNPHWRGIADIGTDHALVLIDLASAYGDAKAPYIGCDIAEGPLRQARARIEAAGFSEAVQLRRGGGFSAIKRDEVDVAVIAGMGPDTILLILQDDLTLESGVVASLDRLVLQANGQSAPLREWLYEAGFVWLGQRLARDRHHHYIVDVLSVGRKPGDRRRVLDPSVPKLREEGLSDWTIFTFGPSLIAGCDEMLPAAVMRARASAAKALEGALAARDGQGIERLSQRVAEMDALVERLSRHPAGGGGIR